MTGRYSIRSGNHTVALAGSEGGLVAWERTMGDILSEFGYATCCMGKWHIGAEEGRWPTDHGFDEWYGPAHSYDECLWPDDPLYDPKRDPVSYMYEGRKGQKTRVLEDQQLTLERRLNVDLEYERRAFDFIRRSVKAGRPFYLYYNHSMMHMPTLPRDEFKGKSGQGEWADCLLELDHDFGRFLDLLDECGIRENTIVVFAGDNGPEDMVLWRGASGFFDGSYFASGEGGIRTPCLICWSGKVPSGQVSNEMVHVTDMFPTLLKWAGCEPPKDRVIDGIDQVAFFNGEQTHSNRDGCIIWNGPVMHGAKWKNFKLLLHRQRFFFEPLETLSTPYLIILITDPKEREPIDHQYLHTWVLAHFGKIMAQFQESVKREPLIPSGAPLDFVPTSPEQK
jgi:arylsulfatase